MSKYKLLESMCLPIYKGHIRWTDRDGAGETSNDDWVRAYDLERALSEAPVVKRHAASLEVGAWYEDDTEPNPTEQARLLCVQEIKRDTAESLLRDLERKLETYQNVYPDDKELRSFRERARRLLEKSNENP